MQGRPHPVTEFINKAAHVFGAIGYTVVEGPEIETEYYNFDALNIPADHPAREMWDTFWLSGEQGMLLRTHTSPVQIRHLEHHKPPVRIIVPGKVFRNEATDQTHEAQFFQLEGLCVDTDVTLCVMKGVLEHALRSLLGDTVSFRYRPSYFPFTEPSLEIDVLRSEKEGWLELLGCGMVHPLLLSRVGVDPRRYRGFAFGMGVDRIVALQSGLDDVRTLYRGDLRLQYSI